MQAVAARTDRESQGLRDPQFLAVCFAIATLPLEISGLWFPTTLINLSRIGMAVAIVLAGIRLVRERRRAASAPGLIVAATLLVLAVDLASALLTRWPGVAREIGPVAFYALFALAVAETLTDATRIRVAAAVFLVAGLAEAALVLVEQAGNFYLTEIRDFHGRRNGTFIDPNIAARYLLLGLVVGIAAVRDRRSWSPLVAIVVGTVFAVAIVLTFSRSGWLLLFVVAGLAVLAGQPIGRARIAAAAAVVAFAVGVLIVPNALHRATDIPAPVDPDAGSARVASLVWSPPRSAVALDAGPTTPLDGVLAAAPIDPVRRYLARAAVAMFVDHPLVGVGLGGFKPEILGPYSGFILPDYRSAPVSVAHTDVLRIAAEEGIVGLAAFVAFGVALVLALRRALRGADALRRVGLQAAGVAILVVFLAAQTEGRFYNDASLWLAIGAIGALGYHRDASPASSA